MVYISPAVFVKGGMDLVETTKEEYFERQEKKAVNRNYKARIFELIFRDKKDLLELYNAVNGTDYENPEELEINTLENAIYLSMRNDVSFIIDSRLSLYEHQSTYNPNLPLRYLMYVSELYAKMTKDANLYGTKQILIPPPKFLIFYNGAEKRPEMEEMRLSDAYMIEDPDPSLELCAVMLNINPGNNEALLDACKSLRDYVDYTSRVRSYAEEFPIEVAVEKAITECIREGILVDFLTKSKAEAKAMSIYEYDEERQRRFDREEGRQEGEARFAALSAVLLESGMLKELRQAVKDNGLREELYKKFLL